MKYPPLTKQIEKMAKIDQEARRKATPGKNFANYLIYAIDGAHNSYLHNIIKIYGYPAKKLVGKRGMKKFWLLVQHQDFDPKLQENCLQRCDFEPKEKAYLTDRILTHQGRKQVYGTQFRATPDKKRLVPFPIDKKTGVDKRRRKMGLETLKVYAERMNRKYAEELAKHEKNERG